MHRDESRGRSLMEEGGSDAEARHTDDARDAQIQRSLDDTMPARNPHRRPLPDSIFAWAARRFVALIGVITSVTVDFKIPVSIREETSFRSSC